MKKTKFLVTTIMSIVLGYTSIAYAKLPSNSLVIGRNAFDINYVFDKNNVGEVNRTINTGGSRINIYYINSAGKIKDIFAPTTLVKEEVLNSGSSILYKSFECPSGINYILRDGEFSFFNRPQVKFNVSLGSIEGNKYIVNITYNSFNQSDNSKNTIDTKFIKFDSLDKVDIEHNKSFIIFTSDKKIPFKTLDSKENEIGIGQIDLSSMRVGESADKACELYKTETKATLDTSVGNVQNSGEAMLEGEYLYYSNSSDNGKLYKIKMDGSENKALSEDKAKHICILKDYVYYSNISDGGKLYKIKNDGSDRQKLSENSVSYIDKSVNDLYFINESEGSKVYKLETNNMNKITKINDDPADSLAILGGEVYYVNRNDSNRLHKVGTPSTRVLDLSVKKFIGKDLLNMIVCTTEGYIYKYDGKNAEKINLKIPNSSVSSKEDRVFNINVIGDYVYYKSINDGGKLYRINIKEGNSELVIPYSVDNIYVLDSENLYFTQGNRMNKLNISMDYLGKRNFLVTPTSKENMKSVIKIKTELKGNSLPPTEVEVEFNDHTTGKLTAYWDTNKPQLAGDETIYTGTLLGGARVQYRYSSDSKDVANVKKNIIRNFNGTYTLIFSGDNIKAGDIVKIYLGDTSYNFIAQQTADRQGIVTFRNLKLEAASKVSITRKEIGKSESKNKVEVVNSITSEPKITSVDDLESVFNGVDGRDISIKLDANSLVSFTNKEIYILPKGRTVDIINSKGLRGYDISKSELWTDKDGVYTGTDKITKDSMGNLLNNGLYDVYLVGVNTDDKYCSDAKSVMVKSEVPAAVMSPEVIGDNFKAKGAIADVKVKLNVRALNGTLINDITTNYDINVLLNGEKLKDFNSDYQIENNNSVILKKEFLNKLDCGTYKFEVILKDKSTSREIKAFFDVVVNSAADFTTNINTTIFTKGYSPESVVIDIIGKDKNGQDFTETQLKDSLVRVNDKPITNFEIKGTSIKLNKIYLDTLESGNYTINIANEDIDLDQQTGFKIASSQAELTPLIEGKWVPFKTGQAKQDMIIKLNAKDEQGKDCEFDGIEGIYYEGTKIPEGMYVFKDNKLTLKEQFLNKIPCGDNEIIIKGKVKETSKIIEGKLNIKVEPAAELKFMLRETNKDKFTIGSSQDLTYDVVQIDENNKNVERSKIDLSNIKLQKGSYVLRKNIDYYTDNINKIITLKKDYLNTLIAGDTFINVSIGDLSKDIMLTAKEGQTIISAEIKNEAKYSHKSATEDMIIEITGISATDVVRVGIKTKDGNTTFLSKDEHYTIDGTDKVIIRKDYLNLLSAATSPYNIVISDANNSANVQFEVLSIARFKFQDSSSEKEFIISGPNSDLNAEGNLFTKILEEDYDGNDINTDLNSITLRLNNEGKELNITPSDYEITGGNITIKKDFLGKLPAGTTEVVLRKDGIVTPLKFILKK